MSFSTSGNIAGDFTLAGDSNILSGVELCAYTPDGNIRWSDRKAKVKKLDPNAIIPTKSRKTDAGLDLYALEDGIVLTNSQPVKVKTGIAIAIPESYVGIICDRSGLGSKGLKVHGGVIDCGYAGDITVCLSYHNDGKSYEKYAYQIYKGDKIAQLLIVPCPHFELELVDELSESDRGDKGFGSSGR